jgi:hypothetical protein
MYLRPLVKPKIPLDSFKQQFAGMNFSNPKENSSSGATVSYQAYAIE